MFYTFLSVRTTRIPTTTKKEAVVETISSPLYGSKVGMDKVYALSIGDSYDALLRLRTFSCMALTLWQAYRRKNI